MEQDLKFLKRETKTGIVVTSVIVSIAVIAMIMTAILVTSVSVGDILAVGTSIIVIGTAIATGISQIKVFRDYKSVKK